METNSLDQPNRHPIYTLAYRYMGTHEDAEDIVQEVLLRLWNHRDRVTSASMTAWLRKTTRNACLNALNRRSTQQKYLSVVRTQNGELALRAESGLLPHTYLLRIALNQVEEPHRSLLFMRYFERMSHKAISQETGMPPNRIKVYLHRGRRKLRTLLE